MKIALAQMQMSKNWDENVDKSLSLLRQAGQQKVDLIGYPEVQMSPFCSISSYGSKRNRYRESDIYPIS